MAVMSLTMITWKYVILKTELKEIVKNVESLVRKFVAIFNVDTLGTDYRTNSHIAKELEITPVLDKLLVYKRHWIQRVNRMPRDRLPRVMKHCCPTGSRNRGRPLKRILDT